MLQIKESERYGWTQIFEDEVIVGDKNKLEASLKLSESQQDKLEKSITLNDAYIQTNLVANYLKNIDDIIHEDEKEAINNRLNGDLKGVNENQANEGQYDNLKAE